jgi:hypothetical protein
MEQLTLTVAAAACVLIFCLPPARWLIIYIALLAYYPQYLSVKIGSLDFMACRIVMVAMYANLLLRGNLIRNFRFSYLDILVIVYFLAQLFSGLLTTDTESLLENRFGIAFDSVLPYFIVRLTVTDKEGYLKLLKWILILAVPIAIVGFYQSVTGHNPAGFLKMYRPWGFIPEDFTSIMQRRYGFYRANVTFPHAILYGLFFAILGPVCAGVLRSITKYRVLYWAGLGFMGMGVFSSMSGGPAFAASIAVVFIVLYKYRKYWKPAVVATILMCGTIEAISNRHFYYYPTRFTFSVASAWYRGRLLDVALFEGGMSGHWLTGYGLATNASIKAGAEWGAKIDHRNYVDMVNEYLLILFRFGLAGLVPFLAMVCAAIKKLIEALKTSLSDSNSWLVWCVFGSLAGILVAILTVSLSGAQTTNLFSILMGLCGVMPLIISDENHRLLTEATGRIWPVKRKE